MTAPSQGGFLEMQTAAVGPQLRVLSEAGTTLQSAWRGANDATVAAEAGIGGGPMGEAFRAVYLEASQSVRSNADAVPPLFQTLTEVGSLSLRDYRTADERGAAGLRRSAE